MNCTSDVATCPDLTKNQAVKLKVNLAYRQPMNRRIKDASKDVWIDLRTGNIEVRDPVGP